MHAETLNWHAVTERLPDTDTTVLIEIDPATPHSEPVWPGYLDGEQWRTAEGEPVTVVAWADLPRGTYGVDLPDGAKHG